MYRNPKKLSQRAFSRLSFYFISTPKNLYPLPGIALSSNKYWKLGLKYQEASWSKVTIWVVKKASNCQVIEGGILTVAFWGIFWMRILPWQGQQKLAD